MEQARAVLQQTLVELVGEDLSRGVHIVLVRERWFQPDHFRTKEPSLASVSKVERSLRPTQPMQERVERMLVVGSGWPLCLLRAVKKRHDMQRQRQKKARRGAGQGTATADHSAPQDAGPQWKRARAKAAAAPGPASGAHGDGAGDAASEADASGPAGGEASFDHPSPSEARDAAAEEDDLCTDAYVAADGDSDSPALPSVEAGRAFPYWS